MASLHSFASESDIRTSPWQQHNETDDSVGNPLKMPDGHDGSFFSHVIPPSPQAAALARYAEYPVSHTTGVPDITIPLYEIRMGDFTLPISISYHASGCRVDEIPTCVGLGWTLNAGGAVTRTILGAPDFEFTDIYNTDCSPRDYSYLMNALGSSDTDLSLAASIISNHPETDTESDRYCLNAGGHSLVFRYSHNDGEFVVLNHENCNIFCRGCGLTSSFAIGFPDGTSWEFTEHERTGVDTGGEGMPYTTAWYVTEIKTPWGNIGFTYRHGERPT